MSAFDNIPQHIADGVYEGIAEELFNNWVYGLLDEGQFYADQQIAIMSGDPTFAEAYNNHYNLKPGDEEYLDVRV